MEYLRNNIQKSDRKDKKFVFTDPETKKKINFGAKNMYDY